MKTYIELTTSSQQYCLSTFSTIAEARAWLVSLAGAAIENEYAVHLEAQHGWLRIEDKTVSIFFWDYRIKRLNK